MTKRPEYSNYEINNWLAAQEEKHSLIHWQKLMFNRELSNSTERSVGRV